MPYDDITFQFDNTNNHHGNISNSQHNNLFHNNLFHNNLFHNNLFRSTCNSCPQQPAGVYPDSEGNPFLLTGEIGHRVNVKHGTGTAGQLGRGWERGVEGG
jgi:hypothetical protein